jgi:hypothetical protein
LVKDKKKTETISKRERNGTNPSYLVHQTYWRKASSERDQSREKGNKVEGIDKTIFLELKQQQQWGWDLVSRAQA